MLSVAPVSQKHMRVQELLDPVSKSLSLEVLSALFLEEEVNLIRTMPNSICMPADCLIWHFHERGFFTVKSGYNVARKLVQSRSLSASTFNSKGNPYATR